MEQLFKNTLTHSKGSLFVDAAISIPAFIIAVALLLQFISVIGKEERSYYIASGNIEKLGLLEMNMNLGHVVDKPNDAVYIDHVQTYPIYIKNEFIKLFSLSMDMPYRTYIGESPDVYNNQMVYIFPKNEGSEKEQPCYHTSYCQTLKGGATKGLEIKQIDEIEAINRGYRLCKHCSTK